MEVTTKRLDHLGIIAGVIKDIRLVELIDNRIPKHAKQDISCIPHTKIENRRGLKSRIPSLHKKRSL